MWQFVKKGAKKAKARMRARRVKHAKKTGGFQMAKRKSFGKRRSGMGMGILGVAYKGALMGMGAATAVNSVTGGEKIPFQSELAAGVAGLTAGKGMKNRIVGAAAGAGATAALKYLPGMLRGANNTSVPSNGNLN